MQTALGIGGHLRQLRQRAPQRQVDLHAPIDGPAAGIEQRAQAALAQLEPGDQHAGARNGQHQPHDGQRNQRPQLQHFRKHRHQHGTERAQGHTDGRHRAHIRLARHGLGGLGAAFGQARGLGLQPLGDGGVLGGSALGHLLFNHAQEFFVRREKRLAHAGGVVDQGGDARIPVLAFTVVKNAFTPDEQKVHIARRERCHDVAHLRAAAAFAVGQIGFGQPGQRRVGAGVLHIHRQLAAAPIQEQRPGLEHAALAAVEAGKRDKVVQQRQQVTLQADEFFQIFGMHAVCLLGAVLLDQRQQARLGIAGQQGLDFFQGPIGHGRSRALRQPGLARCQLRLELLPLRQAQLRQLTPQRGDGLRAQRLHRSRPGRIEAAVQRQQRIGVDARQRQSGDGGIVQRQRLLAQADVAFHAGAQGLQRRGIERRELAARKKIVHLGLHRTQRLGCRLRLLWAGQSAQLLGALHPPIGLGLQIGKKLLQRGLGQPGLVVAALHAAVGLHDALGQRLQVGVRLQCLQRQHAVAIEGHGMQLGQALLHLGQAQAAGPGLTGQRQNALRLGQHGGAVFHLGLQAIELQHIAGAGEHFGIAHMGHGPLAGSEQFGRADTAIAIAVDGVQRGGIELHPPRRAGQRHPEFLVQLRQMGDVGPGADNHLIHASCAYKLPTMRFHRCRCLFLIGG